MNLDDLVTEYKRRTLESVLALIRNARRLSLDELRELLAHAPELRGLTMAELFEGRPTRQPPPSSAAPASTAAGVAEFLLVRARDAGQPEAGGVLVKATATEIAEHVGATPELVNLALAVLARRGLVTVYPRRILVRRRLDLRAQGWCPDGEWRRRVGAL